MSILRWVIIGGMLAATVYTVGRHLNVWGIARQAASAETSAAKTAARTPSARTSAATASARSGVRL